ncbi:MAG TPA: DMT family transporter [Gaiellaceae bacterium]
MTALAVALTLAAGLSGAVQLAVMGRLGERIGAVPALAFAACVSAAVALAALLLVRQSFSGLADATRQPKWMWIGGVAGAFIVFTVTFVAPRIGAFGTTGVFLAAQLTMAVLIDRFGLFGLNRIGLGWGRVAGLVLLAAGAALTLHRA